MRPRVHIRISSKLLKRFVVKIISIHVKGAASKFIPFYIYRHFYHLHHWRRGAIVPFKISFHPFLFCPASAGVCNWFKSAFALSISAHRSAATTKKRLMLRPERSAAALIAARSASDKRIGNVFVFLISSSFSGVQCSPHSRQCPWPVIGSGCQIGAPQQLLT